MTHRASLCSMVTALWIVGSACSNTGSGSTTGAGGSSSSGGLVGTGGSSSGGSGVGTGGSSSGGTGGGGTCTNVTACGGSVVGTWTVSSACLQLSSSNLDTSAAGLESHQMPERDDDRVP